MLADLFLRVAFYGRGSRRRSDGKGGGLVVIVLVGALQRARSSQADFLNIRREFFYICRHGLNQRFSSLFETFEYRCGLFLETGETADKA